MEDSIFTKIIKGEIPCYKIYEDEKTLAFLDIAPEVEGHTLVIPKKQINKVYELPEEDYVALFATVKKVAARIEEVTGQRAVMKVIGTDVPHAHVHVMPISESWEYGKTLELPAEKMEEIRAKLAFEDN